MQWLGVGRVRVGFDIDGQLHGAHEFLNANKYDGVYMKSATLPFRYEIENTSTVAAAPTLNQICTTVESEGGASIDQALTFTAGNGATKVALSSVWTPIASIRPAPTLNGITNRARAVITGFDVISDTASQFALFYNTTLSSGTSWTSVNSSHSAVQLDVASGSAAGGILFDSAYVPGAGGNRTVSISNPTVTEYPFTLNIAGDTGSGTPITLQGRTFAGNNSAAVMFTWIEEY